VTDLQDPGSASTRKWLLITGGSAGLLLGVSGLLFFVLRGESSAQRALALKDQLIATGEELSSVERNRLLVQLMRTVDEMDREQLRTLRQQWRLQRMSQLDAALTEYRAASSWQKPTILDRQIDQFVKLRPIDEALSGGSRGGAGWGGRRRNGRGDVNQQDRVQDPQRAERMAFLQAMQQRAEKRGISLRRR
jgi:hypothetical protein